LQPTFKRPMIFAFLLKPSAPNKNPRRWRSIGCPLGVLKPRIKHNWFETEIVRVTFEPKRNRNTRKCVSSSLSSILTLFWFRFWILHRSIRPPNTDLTVYSDS
jgi:hypothetical protein